MDDPWANAWGEPEKPVIGPVVPSDASWVTPTTRIIPHGEQEADISWPTGADIRWSDNSTTDGSLWSPEPTLTTAWELSPSVYEGISLGKLPTPDLGATGSTSPKSTQSSPIPNVQDLDAAELPENKSYTKPPTPTSRPLTPRSISPAPDSPDAFGTFEAAPESGEEFWSASRPTPTIPSANGDPWGAAWETADSPVSKPADEPADEWEVARKVKERQDRHLPPELLSSILERFAELSREIWPEDSPKAAAAPPSLEDIGLTSIMNKLVPDDLTLPPQVQSCKTFTSKQISEALRLTRHLPLTRKSPMALYMASKGSTSWEASVKAQPQLAQEDFTPPGWKLVEKVEPSPADDDKKSAGGLLSFFGRKPTKSISDSVNVGRSAPSIKSPSRSASPNPSQAGGSSPRGSVDSAKSIPGVHRGAVPSPTSLSFSLTKTPDPNPIATPEANAGDQIEVPSDPVPPSAVSRFFGRFSRTAKTTSPQSLSNPRNSLALSQDDLEFLSDVIPSAQDDVDHQTQLDTLTDMIGSSPLPGTLPPPLPPPPRLQQSRRPSSSLSSSVVSPSKPNNDDIMSLFGPSSLDRQSPVPDLFATIPSNKEIGNSSLSSVIQPLPVKNATPPAGSSNVHATLTDDRWHSFDFLPPATAKPQSHVPPTKRKIAAIMSQTPSASAPNASEGLVFNLPGNSSYTSPQRFGKPSAPAIPFLPPPPSSRSQTPHQQPAPAAKLILEDDDDDFSDFLSSPSQAAHLPPLLGSTVTPVFPEQSSQAVSQHALNDFDALIKPTKTSSFPPQPPAKPLHFNSRSPPSKSHPLHSEKRPSASPPPQQTPARRVSRAADHSRTLSLLETVASRGRWLEPPSPLPEALPPPGASAHSFDLDIFSSQSTMEAQQANATAGFSPPLLPSRTHTTTQPVPSSNGNFLQPIPTIRPFSVSPVSPSSTIGSSAVAKTGGLSAQDLSFFEGL